MIKKLATGVALMTILALGACGAKCADCDAAEDGQCAACEAKETAEAAADKVKDAVEEAVDKAGDLVDEVKDKAGDLVESRGGMTGIKEDLAEVKEIATGEGSLKDKAKAAVDVLKQPHEEEGEEPTTPTDS